MESYRWIEKYRPKSLDNMVLSDDYKNIFKQYILNKEIPDLMFYGSPGSGKTCIARIIIDSIFCENKDTDVLEISGSEKTGVDNVRDNIQEFLKTPSFSGYKKIVFIDEADYLSTNAQAALRSIMNTYINNGSFLFTVNYYNKIIDPIKSRIFPYEFKSLSKEYVDSYCKNILKLENITYNIDLDNIITAYFPDVRRIINFLQSRSINNNLSLSYENIHEYNIIKLIINSINLILTNNWFENSNNINDIITITSSNDIDYTFMYISLFNSNLMQLWAKIIVCEYADTHNSSLIPQMHFMAMIFKLFEGANKLLKLLNNK